MSSDTVWCAISGPGLLPANSTQSSAVKTIHFAKREYDGVLDLQLYIAQDSLLSVPANEIGIWMVDSTSIFAYSKLLIRLYIL